jgi:predicted nicotinamide N-methyase
VLIGFVEQVVWKITPLFAEWISNPRNVLFQTGVLDKESRVLELGCGISGIISLIIAPRIRKYFATDQDYVLKVLRENIQENEHLFTPSVRKASSKSRKLAETDVLRPSDIETRSLDWETDSQSNLYSELGLQVASDESLDLVIACDCIYNTHLISPLVNTCAEICLLAPSRKPTLCVIAQQLRSAEVFEEWLTVFHEKFEVWRVPDAVLIDGLKEGEGFVLHFGLLRGWRQET